VDAARLARYPFLPEAHRLVEEEGPPMGRLLEAKAWAGARSRGQERVLTALEGDPAPATHAKSEHEALVDVLGYAVARLLVSVVDERLLVNRFATAESRRVGEALADEPDEVLQVVSRELGVPVERRDSEETYAVPFQDYLRASQDIPAIEWKLVNRTVDEGEVLLARDQAVRLVQEALKRRLAAELPLELPRDVQGALDELTEPVTSALADLRAGRTEIDVDEVRPERFPPCMSALVDAIHEGENVPHEGRFAIVAFLHTIGMGRDAIINELFPHVPDFAKDVTEYQVDHITGQKSKEAYTPPGCASMQTYGLCPMMQRDEDEWEEWCAHEKMNHPLTYYRWGLYVDEQRDKRPGAEPEGDEPPDEPDAEDDAEAAGAGDG
jgi:DNA primase large subunit